MGGSSGGGGNSSASQLPTWISGPHKSLVSKAESFAYGDRGAYVPYTSERIEGFSGAENTAFGARQDLFNRGDPMGEFAQGQLNYGSDAVPGIMGDANRTFSGQTVNDYMSPYMQGVIDPQLREANLSFDKQLNQNEAQSTSRGASVGSYRQGLERLMTNQNRAQTLSDITGRGKQAAYESGLGAFQRDRDARMGGAVSTVQANQALAGTADQVGSGNLNRMESLASGLEKSGATQRELGQRELDLAYSDFTQERDWPMRNMSFLAGILGGVPSNQYAQTNTQSAQPGLMSQLASLGLGAASLQQGFGAGYANGGIVSGYADGGEVGRPRAMLEDPHPYPIRREYGDPESINPITNLIDLGLIAGSEIKYRGEMNDRDKKEAVRKAKLEFRKKAFGDNGRMIYMPEDGNFNEATGYYYTGPGWIGGVHADPMIPDGLIYRDAPRKAATK